MLTRRQTVLGGLLTIAYMVGAPCQCLARTHRVGCVLLEDEVGEYWGEEQSRLFITGNEPMIPRSGNRDFDFALAQTLAKISETLQVVPGFAYYDDYDAMNAYATPAVRLNNADGTVLFGKRLLGQLLNSDERPGVSVAAVCAHEFGHILQFKHGLDRVVGHNQPTVKRVELQADFFAGYFAGRRKLEKSDFPAAVFAVTQNSFGDNMTGDPGHHGTPEERGDAIVKGFRVAYYDKKQLSEAIQISIDYVGRL